MHLHTSLTRNQIIHVLLVCKTEGDLTIILLRILYVYVQVGGEETKIHKNEPLKQPKTNYLFYIDFSLPAEPSFPYISCSLCMRSLVQAPVARLRSEARPSMQQVSMNSLVGFHCFSMPNSEAA